MHIVTMSKNAALSRFTSFLQQENKYKSDQTKLNSTRMQMWYIIVTDFL